MHDFMRNKRFDLIKLRPIGLAKGNVFAAFNAFFVRSSLHLVPRVRFWKAVNDVGGEKRIWAMGY